MALDPATIAPALRVPAQAVASNWPLIVAALGEFGVLSDLVEVGAAATVAVETGGTFAPVHEILADPARQPELAARQAQYAPYTGRGFVQITWRANYAAAGSALGVDLVGNPELALDPAIAARVLAWFFSTHPSPEHNVATAANAQRWDLVRERVNGGLNGWEPFKAGVDALLGALNG